MKPTLFLHLFVVFVLGSCTAQFTRHNEKTLQIAELTNPRLLKGELRVTLKNIRLLHGDSLEINNIKNNIPADQPPTLLLWSAQIRSFPNQRQVKILTVDPAPTHRFTEAENGNPVLFWNLSSDLKAHDSLVIIRRFQYICYDYHPNAGLDSFVWDAQKIPDSIRTFYTKSEPFLEQTPEIKATALKIVGAETNGFKQARLLHHWIHDTMTYVYPPDRRGAMAALDSLRGDCGQYADLFIALARSLGIPARLQAGFVFSKERVSYHVWAEIYLPHKGWFPVDPTRENGFGFLDNKRLIASVGMNIPLKFTPDWATFQNSEVENGRTDFMQLVTIVKSGFTANISTRPVVLKDSLLTK